MNNLKSRLSKEKRFQIYGLSSILIALFLLSLLFVSIFSQGYTAFQETRIQLPISFDKEILDPNNTKDWNIIRKSNFNSIVKNSVSKIFPDVSGRTNKRKLYKIISNSAEYNW
jgi:phosphate transport system permease protein